MADRELDLEAMRCVSRVERVGGTYSQRAEAVLETPRR
jgi:hypothetical protein